jgi:GMP synthase (glutamine-hydrolysing)
MKPVVIVQNCQAEGPGSMIEYLGQKGLAYTVVHSYRNEVLPSAADVSALINLGCPLSASNYSDHDFLKRVYSLVAESVRYGVPYLGICFGGQILARVLGAKVEPNPVKEIGMYQVQLTAQGTEDPVFAGFSPSFGVAQWHGDTFRIPFGASHLAEADDCKHQAFRAGRAVGLQFHLESTYADLVAWCDSYPEELAETGRDRQVVLAAAKAQEAELRRLNYLLLDNFLAMRQQ